MTPSQIEEEKQQLALDDAIDEIQLRKLLRQKRLLDLESQVQRFPPPAPRFSATTPRTVVDLTGPDHSNVKQVKKEKIEEVLKGSAEPDKNEGLDVGAVNDPHKLAALQPDHATATATPGKRRCRTRVLPGTYARKISIITKEETQSLLNLFCQLVLERIIALLPPTSSSSSSDSVPANLSALHATLQHGELELDPEKIDRFVAQAQNIVYLHYTPTAKDASLAVVAAARALARFKMDWACVCPSAKPRPITAR